MSPAQQRLEADLVALEELKKDIMRELERQKPKRKTTPSERLITTWAKAKAYDRIIEDHPEMARYTPTRVIRRRPR